MANRLLVLVPHERIEISIATGPLRSILAASRERMHRSLWAASSKEKQMACLASQNFNVSVQGIVLERQAAVQHIITSAFLPNIRAPDTTRATTLKRV